MNRILEAIENCVDISRLFAVVVLFLIFSIFVIGACMNFILFIKEKLIKNGNICKKCGFFRNKNILEKSCTGGFSDKNRCGIKTKYEKNN